MPTTITLEKAVQSLFETLPGIALVPLSRDLARRAVEIAIRHRLRGADAIYVAVAEQAGSSLVSWDQEMLERGRAVVTTVTPVKVLSDQL
jgi:predicted nucleic acid-binding protein